MLEQTNDNIIINMTSMSLDIIQVLKVTIKHELFNAIRTQSTSASQADLMSFLRNYELMPVIVDGFNNDDLVVIKDKLHYLCIYNAK